MGHVPSRLSEATSSTPHSNPTELRSHIQPQQSSDAISNELLERSSEPLTNSSLAVDSISGSRWFETSIESPVESNTHTETDEELKHKMKLRRAEDKAKEDADKIMKLRKAEEEAM